MKPLTHCPYCKSPLIKKTIPEELNPTKYENCSERCIVDYFQYYQTSYEDKEIQYASFATPDGKFHVYYYTDHWAYPINTLHVHSEAELEKYGISSPCLILDNFTVDFDELEKLQQKLSIYMTFS